MTPVALTQDKGGMFFDPNNEDAPGNIAGWTGPQIVLGIFSSWVLHERAEERSKRERTCENCAKEEMDTQTGVCRNPKCGFRRVQAMKPGTDVIFWGGRRYVGDANEPAIAKLKRENPAGYRKYVQGEMIGRRG